MNLIMIILGVGFVLALLFVLGAMLIAGMRTSRRPYADFGNTRSEDVAEAETLVSDKPRSATRSSSTVGDTGTGGGTGSNPGPAAKRTLDLLAKLPPDSRAIKCRHCGATVDSTAELSSNGEIRCNYCSQWTSIYDK